MAGTIEGGKKAKATNKRKYGEDFYARIGQKGGSVQRRESRPFFVDRELAESAGRKGGQISRRRPKSEQ